MKDLQIWLVKIIIDLKQEINENKQAYSEKNRFVCQKKTAPSSGQDFSF